MTVLEAEVSLDDLPTTWERDAGPFLFALLGGRRLRGRLLAVAPIGVWALPQLVGEVVTSRWPARFVGPLAAARAWELRAPGEPPSEQPPFAGGTFRFPTLGKPDTLEVSLTLTGVP